MKGGKITLFQQSIAFVFRWLRSPLLKVSTRWIHLSHSVTRDRRRFRLWALFTCNALWTDVLHMIWYSSNSVSFGRSKNMAQVSINQRDLRWREMSIPGMVQRSRSAIWLASVSDVAKEVWETLWEALVWILEFFSEAPYIDFGSCWSPVVTTCTSQPITRHLILEASMSESKVSLNLPSVLHSIGK